MKVYRTTKIAVQTGNVIWQRLAFSKRQYASAASAKYAAWYRLTLEEATLDESDFRLIEAISG